MKGYLKLILLSYFHTATLKSSTASPIEVSRPPAPSQLPLEPSELHVRPSETSEPRSTPTIVAPSGKLLLFLLSSVETCPWLAAPTDNHWRGGDIPMRMASAFVWPAFSITLSSIRISMGLSFCVSSVCLDPIVINSVLAMFNLSSLVKSQWFTLWSSELILASRNLRLAMLTAMYRVMRYPVVFTLWIMGPWSVMYLLCDISHVLGFILCQMSSIRGSRRRSRDS